MTKSEDFDKRERKFEDPLSILKDVIPIVESFMNRTKPIKIELRLQPHQVAELSILLLKWKKDEIKHGD